MFEHRFPLARTAALGLLVLLAGFPSFGGAADPYEINAILPLTGAASFLGKEEAAALQVVEDTVNKSGGIHGRPIHFVIADDQSNPQVAVELTNGVVAKKVPVLLGSSLVAACNAMAPLAKDGPAIYCFSPGIHPTEGSYLFSSSLSTTDLLAASARYFKGRGWHKVAIITSTDATGQDAERNIDGAFGSPENAAVESIVAREHFNITDLSVAAQMAHIKASGAQALIAWSTGTPVATLLRGASEAGVDIPIMTGDGNLTYAQMHAYASFMPKELYIAAPPAVAPDQIADKKVRDAVASYINAFKPSGVRPDIGQSLAWDPALLVVDALKKLGLNATPAQIREEIDGIKGWAGINGEYDFHALPQRGVGVNSVIMVRWDPAKDTWVGVSKAGGAPL
jgi:branched-chain amino acid transport system substrate-binding protein